MTSVRYSGLITAVAACVALGPLTKTAGCQLVRPDTCRNAIYAEVFGPGLLYSINYDYLVAPQISLRAGVSRWSFPAIFFLVNGSIDFTGFPITLNYLPGGGNSHPEIGAGLVAMLISLNGEEVFFGESVRGKASAVLGTATIGYRYQPMDGGFVFRIGFTPVFNFRKIFPTGGISMGLAF